jgi:cyclopropane-fatty-acyl-phospholipid synthase
MLISAAESGRLPDPLLRAAIELRLRNKVRHESRGGATGIAERKRALLDERAAGPITTHVSDANEQHYEVPSDFFRLILGPRLRYSCCYWPDSVGGIASAEEAALDQTVTRARIQNGDRVLELGSGWGSLSLYMAERFPQSEIVAMSNSRTQKSFIDAEAERRGLTNLRIVTADIARFEPQGRFDRVVSVEMFEHVRNHRMLMERIAGWMEPEATCFVHVFSHHSAAWHLDAADPSDWLARHFFAGGTMPSDDLLLHEQRDLLVVDHWRLDGSHYAKTLQAWLDRLDERRDECLEILASGDDPAAPELQLGRWRLFLLASIGTWGMSGGAEFGVSHYLFRRR